MGLLQSLQSRRGRLPPRLCRWCGATLRQRSYIFFTGDRRKCVVWCSCTCRCNWHAASDRTWEKSEETTLIWDVHAPVKVWVEGFDQTAASSTLYICWRRLRHAAINRDSQLLARFQNMLFEGALGYSRREMPLSKPSGREAAAKWGSSTGGGW